MSQYPEPPPYGAYGAYGGGAAPRQRARPSWRWFVAGAGLLVVGLALTIPAIVWSAIAFTQVEARVAADGVTRTVRVEAGTDYLLWKRPAETVRCTIVDGEERTQLALRELGTTSYSRDVGDDGWEGARLFTPLSDSVEVTCSPGSSVVEIGERPRVHTLVGGIFVGLVLPVLVAIAGVAVLLVVTILYAVRPRRVTDVAR